MDLYQFTQLLAGLALVFAVLAFAQRMRQFRRLTVPVDRAPSRGSRQQGMLYALTLGMSPLAKESTRRHMLAYLRGVVFHLGIFLGIAILLASPWIELIPAALRTWLAVASFVTGLLGLAGFAARLLEHNLKALSTPDDLFSVLLVSLFLFGSAWFLVDAAAAPLYYLVTALLLVYAPFSKIRHCIYFGISRIFFGKFFGTRGVLPHSQQVLR